MRIFVIQSESSSFFTDPSFPRRKGNNACRTKQLIITVKVAPSPCRILSSLCVLRPNKLNTGIRRKKKAAIMPWVAAKSRVLNIGFIYMSATFLLRFYYYSYVTVNFGRLPAVEYSLDLISSPSVLLLSVIIIP